MQSNKVNKVNKTSIKICVYKASIFFIFNFCSISIEEAKTLLNFFKYVLRKRKGKTKLLFIQITDNLLHI